jgi:radical SAM superfamily enzyme YgiQ (UPF0313 family)
VGRILKDAPFRAGLVYPSPYFVAMSSLGFQTVYGLIQSTPNWCCERIFHPDRESVGLACDERPVSYEGERPMQEFSVLAFSVAYELELCGLIRMLEAGGIPALREQRGHAFPLVLAGGPLTFSNAEPLLPYVDAVLLGECENTLPWALEVIANSSSRADLLESLSCCPSIVVPSIDVSQPAVLARADDRSLPAFGPIRTPDTELSSMFLVETARGCSRGCTYCVMRRSTNGGMRIVDRARIIGSVPQDARRVGLVGAAVSDHPQIVDIVNSLVDRGCNVGLSSLRPDKLDESLVAALARAGYRTLTTALDGASERLRKQIDRRGWAAHYVRAAQLARAHRMEKVKLYLMLGLPGETDADVDECASFVASLSAIIPVTLGISPFCAKRNTPLDGLPFAGVTTVQRRLIRLRSKLAGRAEVRPTSSRWAWVEYVLSQGRAEEGRAVLDALQAGGTFAAFREAFASIGHLPDKPKVEMSDSGTRRLRVTPPRQMGDP